MRNAPARLLIALATLAGTVALTAYLLLATTLNPHRVGDVAASLLDDPAGRTAITRALADGIERSTGQSLSTAQEQELRTQLTGRDVRRALRRTSFTPRGRLNYKPLLRVVAARLRAHGQPAAAAVVMETSGQRISVPSAIFHRYTRAHDVAETVRRWALVAAVALALLGLLVASDRRWALRRAGWGILGTVAGAVVLYLVVPRVAAAVIGDNIGTALLTALGTGLVAPLVVVAVVGVGVIALSHIPLRRRA